MPRVEATAVVPLDANRVFALSQTYGELRYRWDPFVIEQRLLGGALAAGKGVRTWTRSRHRFQMVSQYVSFRPPEHVGMRMLSGPWFFATFSGGWNFTPVEGGTRATWRYNFTIRPPWLAPVADRIGVWLLGREIRRRLAGFARACADPDIVSALGTTEPERPRPDTGDGASETAATGEQPVAGAERPVAGGVERPVTARPGRSAGTG